MESIKKRRILLLFIGIQFDALGVSLLLAVGLGASPFGMLMANLQLVIPIYIGILSVFYDIVVLSITKVITKERFAYASLFYSLIFASFLQVYVLLFSSISYNVLIVQIIIAVLAIGMLDLGKYLLYHGHGPKLSTALIIYALSNKTKYSLNIISKFVTGIIVSLAILISLIHGEYFHQLGWMSLIYFLIAGYTLKWLQKRHFLKSHL